MQIKSAWELISLGIDIATFRIVDMIPEIGKWEDDPESTLRVPSSNEIIEKLEQLDLLGSKAIVRLVSGNKGHFPGTSEYYTDALLSVLESESERIQVFSPSPTRWDTQKLLKRVSELFATNIFTSLHEVAQSDFQEAGRCIVFDLPTSAAFHLMRGTEKILKDYYRLISGNDAGNKTWGRIIDELRNHPANSSPKSLLDHLDNIRENFRNPTQHPDKIYTLDEAQDLFGVCVDVVDQLIPLIWQEENKNL